MGAFVAPILRRVGAVPAPQPMSARSPAESVHGGQFTVARGTRRYRPAHCPPSQIGGPHPREGTSCLCGSNRGAHGAGTAPLRQGTTTFAGSATALLGGHPATSKGGLRPR